MGCGCKKEKKQRTLQARSVRRKRKIVVKQRKTRLHPKNEKLFL
jgi:hypothetical protein